jgi:putative glutamine amidotransferase
LLVLSGGESLGENMLRDAFEASLLDHSACLSLPVLGICRGMQVMAHYFGAKPEKVAGHAGTRHEVSGIFQSTVNSFHNYGFQTVPSEFDVIARAPDKSVEMIHHTSLPWLGVMWHPEREPVASWSNILMQIK